jgi:NADH dehydrogenase
MARNRVVVLGGGFGGLFTALSLAGSADVTLVSDEDHFVFTPMLYEYLSGEVEEWHIAPRYTELFDDNVNLLTGRVTGIDSIRKRWQLTVAPIHLRMTPWCSPLEA